MLARVDDAQLARRFGAIEQQLRLISQQLGIDCPPFASDGLGPEVAEPAGSGGPGAGGRAIALGAAL
jgi:hypothetical protein